MSDYRLHMRAKCDNLKLIQLVQQRPCLWDKTLELHKDKVERAKAWNEVFYSMEESYETATDAEKKEIGEVITTKWNNIRDAYVKTIKRRNNRGFGKKYIYHDSLEFLKKIVETDDESDNLRYDYEETQRMWVSEILESSGIKSEEICLTPVTPSIPEPSPRKKTKRNMCEGLESATSINVSIQKLDEDEAFFVSLLPTVKSFSEDEKFDFRIRVMQVIQDIKRQSLYSHETNPHFIPHSSSYKYLSD